MSLFLDDGDVRLYHGDALTVLQTLEDASVHMCVTSPPFYGLRSYLDDEHEDKPLEIGLEETPEQWVDSLVNVFREVRRVLRDDGVLFVEVGDSYVSGQGGRQSSVGELPPTTRSDRVAPGPRPDLENAPAGWGTRNVSPRFYPGRGTRLKPKDLIGAPWQLAFALRADGWYLRSDIVWARPNPMPESVTDRPTKSHSYVFLLSKRPRYFFDQEAVRESQSELTLAQAGRTRKQGAKTAAGDPSENRAAVPAMVEGTSFVLPNGRNVRSVWNIATQPYPEAHFATFPEELARRCILAGTSERGCCPECGAPWVREVDLERSFESGSGRSGRDPIGKNGLSLQGGGETRDVRRGPTVRTTTLGWRPSCGHYESLSQGTPSMQDSSRWDTVPCVVLDPFVGSGTVPYVARKHGRHSIGIDLSQSYLELAARRLQQLSLFA